MRYPVYAFRGILREVRRDAGLSVLAAAQATGYGNYERWESGATRVGPQHLRGIADAFAITDELGLLLYAWLVDRFSPSPGQGSVDLAETNLEKSIRQLPRDVVDLGENSRWVVEPGQHVEVAVTYLVARYRRSERVLLPPVPRTPLPGRRPDESILLTAYGDLGFDAARLMARTLIRSANKSSLIGPDPARTELANLAPLLATPEGLEAMANEFGGPQEADVRRVADLLREQQEAMAELVRCATTQPATVDAVAQLANDVVVGRFDRLLQILVAAMANGEIRGVDPAILDELEAMLDRAEAYWRDEVRHQLIEGSARLDVDGLFDVLDLVTDAARAS